MEGFTNTAPKTESTSSDVGTLLCATRMRLGKDLQRIAEILHIRYNYLVAMEDGRYEDLPGQAYAIGFVRAYADHLGLDGDEIVRRYKEESSGLKNRPVFEFPLPTPDSGVPSGALILIAVVLGMAVYGVWYGFAGADREDVQVIQEVPDRLAEPAPVIAAKKPDPLPADGAAVGMDIASEDESTTAALPPGAFPPPAGAAPTGSAAPAPTFSEGEFPQSEPTGGSDESETGVNLDEPPPGAYADTLASVATPKIIAPAAGDAPQAAAAPADVVELRAKSDVWITLRTSNNPDRTQLLHKGETFRAPEGGGGMTLVTATPAELDILVNGQVMPPMDAGVFARGVPLDLVRLKSAGTPPAVKPAAKPAP